ncbi:hypothetical protein FNO01nite_03250 [Flavobacterium noncentrifugens]|uniref:Methyltransferase domain-containing protein n=1 Tax=Flavobacterium noncentrifugens TaxID=1128970 RepID=A0A1G8S0C4_9FLAO|nr:class I SAM-dependent methyltransferase [Flavobacterium noncentrifugens]GEP49653.1 hypothetical protein FNO01nite_03250 [Flavobacterium noncentrifugens]SDJ22714.1 Methyltransferase domain-containing protein [Flavobacterium noncentrifugens]
MANSFDSAAAVYDETFTHSVIGKLQRGIVQRHFQKILDIQKPKTILEINCGTGEDAIWLAKQNFKVTATDLSEKMIAVAKTKENQHKIIFKKADINELPTDFTDEKFDLIFSNFGGLNCLSEIRLELFFKNAAELLSENGHLILVIMPKNTLWEQFYFLAKANFKSAFRRKKHPAIANINGEKVLTYYYNPMKVKNLADGFFKLIKLHPVGFFVPPSYLEPFFRNKHRLISALSQLENGIQNRKSLSRFSDHYFIALQKL